MAATPVPKRSIEAGSGTPGGGGVGVLGGGGVGVGVELGVSLQLSQSLVCIKAIGTAARNRKGHFGKDPPATRMSPQSQIVPSTSPSSITSTPRRCPSPVTVTPEISDSFLPPCAGACGVVSPRGPPCCLPLPGSCATSVLSLRSGVPRELVSVWTTWLMVTGSANAGADVKRKMQSTVNSAQQSRRPRCGDLLVKIWAEVGFIQCERSESINSNRPLASSIIFIHYKDTANN